MHPRNEKLLQNARNLRKNMTKEERHLWFDYLRDYPIRFRRQEIIGNYIADFYCSAAALVVELDGSQHYEEKGKTTNLERTSYLEDIGLTVLRFSNLDVMRNFRGVCEQIDESVRGRVQYTPAAKASPERKGAQCVHCAEEMPPLKGEVAESLATKPEGSNPSVTAGNSGDSSPCRGAKPLSHRCKQRRQLPLQGGQTPQSPPETVPSLFTCYGVTHHESYQL